MEKPLVALVEKAHPWVVDLILLTIGVAVLVWVWSAISVLKQNITVHATADSLLTLQKEYNALIVNNNLLQEKFNQLVVIMAGIKNIYTELKYLFYSFAAGEDVQGRGYVILKLITDRISSDLKSSAGEMHRCAIWLNTDDDFLCMYVASSGFSDYYRNYRTLEIDSSCAGRSFRTKTTRYVKNVLSDKDFHHNPNSPHKYMSMICVPLVLGDLCLGVITVDGIDENAFKDEDISTIETYGEVAAIIRMMQISGVVLEEESGESESKKQ